MKNILELLKKGLKLNNKIMTNIFLIISIVLSLIVLPLNFHILICLLVSIFFFCYFVVKLETTFNITIIKLCVANFLISSILFYVLLEREKLNFTLIQFFLKMIK